MELKQQLFDTKGQQIYRSARLMRPRSALLTLIAWALLAASTLASASKNAPPVDPIHVNKCSRLLELTAFQLGYLRDEFKHNKSYTHEVKTTSIKDQCNGESCWAYSRLADLETKILVEKGRSISLSEHYVTTRYLQEHAAYALNHPDYRIEAGGWTSSVDGLIRKYGLIPSTAWKPRIDFEQNEHLSRLHYYMNGRVAQFYAAISAKKLSKAQKKQLQAEAKKDLRDLIAVYSGPIPETFEYKGKIYTPKTWAKRFLPKETKRPLFQVPRVEGAKRYASSQRPIEDLEQKIIDALSAGETPIINFETPFIFIDDTLGIMSIEAFHVPEGFAVPSRARRREIGLALPRHLSLVVGADVDPATGRLIKLKIKNSWGTRSGDDGYYHMYRDYFEQFLDAVYLRH